ncbi:bifunctional 2-polyprenyl-6-hydroxyphenol methylase/3-demethylubiquinol 3-O-methyltransferase UbiG [Paenibacillus sp. FSL H7-0331]|uniref:class I SAM-dependent methyltransferase n=2 Tax=unclassified Paenibacillus TaxID=185978 RepID=UPI00096FB90A|nr:class I SAM-dependent methyltransferase [Paenibacillus sp. FSL H7-0331]OMF02618.1 SAM-dependent methyltransferase [Paenibacillus sp. FSL H7-0331]
MKGKYENELSLIGNDENEKTPEGSDSNVIQQKNSYYWDTKGNEFLKAIVLPYYGAFISEENYQLFGDISEKKLLEIGCGNGQSMQYHAERNASELWALDISERQIEKAARHLVSIGVSAKLICSPMEEECGIPEDYFDYVYSIYAIGWTIDLEGTFCRIASYLKKDGVFIFSWSHPIHRCVTDDNGRFFFQKSYFDETWYPVAVEGELLLADRKLSCYVNALAKAGFVVEQMIEQPDDDIMHSSDNNSDKIKRAKMLPLTFVIKARKL